MGTHLILHKVRGEPEFDIAEKAQIGEEEGWIISTSGHRAYPYRLWELEELIYVGDINGFGHHDRPTMMTDGMPADWPDHYPTKAEPMKAPGKIHDFLNALGLGVKVVRRV